MEHPATTWKLTNGSAKSDASSPRTEQLAPFERILPPAGAADQTHFFTVNQTGVVTWVVHNVPYTHPRIPILKGSVSGGWQTDTTVHMPFNSTIDIIMNIVDDSKDMVRSSHPFLPWSISNRECRWATQCTSTAIDSGSSAQEPVHSRIRL